LVHQVCLCSALTRRNDLEGPQGRVSSPPLARRHGQPISNDAAQVNAFMSGMDDTYRGSIRAAHDMQRIPLKKQEGQ
jgi:hypothetical protein